MYIKTSSTNISHETFPTNLLQKLIHATASSAVDSHIKGRKDVP